MRLRPNISHASMYQDYDCAPSILALTYEPVPGRITLSTLATSQVGLAYLAFHS